MNVYLFEITLLWTFLLVVLEFVCTQQTQDYCSWETFNPSCEDSEVIIVEKALYGLMKTGRCVERDFGFLGCSSEQLAFLDSKCSGLRSCAVLVGNKEIKANIPCPDHYLEASYTCQKVTSVDNNKCTAPINLQVKSTPNYIASLTSQESSCGLGSSPWILTAHPGQQINLTLINFAWGDGNAVPSVQNGQCGVTYGHILSNVNNDMIDICGGNQRRTHLKLVNSHQVQIVLQEVAVQSYQFLIHFQAIGCADIVPPKNAWMKKDSNDVTIGCHSSTDSWKLKCIGNHWIGTMGNCSAAVIKQPVSKSQEEEFNHNHVTAVAVGCVALIICCITITIGGYFIKRYKMKVKSGYTKTASEMFLMPNSRFSTTRPNTNTLSQTSTLPVGQSTFLQPVTIGTAYRPRNDDRINDGRSTFQDNNSVQHFILEKPPGFEENTII